MSSASESKGKLLLIWSLTRHIVSLWFQDIEKSPGHHPRDDFRADCPERETGKPKASRNRPHLVSLGFKLVPSTVSCLRVSVKE